MTNKAQTKNGSISKATKADKSAVPSVEKALDIIEYLSEMKEGATMKELVDGLNRSMGELYRIVVYLTDSNYLELDKNSGRYSLTLKLFEVSHRHDPTDQLLSHAIPLMQRFSSLTCQSCHIGVLNRENVLILASTPSPRPAGYSVRTGSMFPVQDTSTGTVIVALSEEDTQMRYLKRLLEADRKEGASRLKDIAAKGHEIRESVIVDGVLNLSVPVFNARGVAAALTCGYIKQKPEATNSHESLEILLNIAGELSRSLGYSERN